MILSFDKFERYESPHVTLCNPNSRATEVDEKITITDTVGVLSNPKGMNLKLNFNAPHELSFDYYRHKSTDPIKQSFYDSIYEAIQTDRYIYLTDIGYFIISSVTDSDEDNIDKKSISLKSCEENELAIAEGLHLKEGTYYLHTDNNDGLLDLFFPKTAGWTMGYIDPSLLTKPYFVEDTEVDNGYNFLYTTIQDMFECIVEPDIIKRTISVYSRVYYAEHHLTDIHIAKYNLLKHKTVEENDEDKYTALNVQGKDENLEIRVVNPTGKNVIYNFEPRYVWMSSALQEAIEKWKKKCEFVVEDCTQYISTLSEFQGGYADLQKEYYDELEKLFNEEKDIEVLKGELEKLKETKDIAFTMADGDEKDQSLNNVNKAIATKQTEINSVTSAYNAHKKTVNTTYEIPIAQINKDCALDITAIDINGNSIFTADLLNELMTHIKPTDYVDEYMLVTESMTYSQRFEKAKELMDRAQSQLVKISSGQKTYSIDTRSFLFNKQFKHFSEQLCAGAIIYVETKSDTMEQLHLTGIDINFDDKSTNFTLGNKYDRSDLKALYEDSLGKNSKSFSELKYIASIIEDQQKQLDYQRNWVANLRTLTLDNVLTSEDQSIEINNRGLIGRKRRLNEDGSWETDENGNPLFELEQVKLINNTLVFTEDNWNTASTAVGKIAVGYNSDGSVKYAYGINGQVLIGELILGNNLVLTGTSAGIKIADSNGNNVFYADDEGNLVLSGKIFANGGSIGGFTLADNKLYSNSVLNNNNGTNVTNSVGLSSCTDEQYYMWAGETNGAIGGIDSNAPFKVDKNGNIYASAGTIGGWTIIPNWIQSAWIHSAPNDNEDPTSHNGIALGYDQNGNAMIVVRRWENSSGSYKHIDTFTINGTTGDVTIAGTINALAGSIGGWNLKDVYDNSATSPTGSCLWANNGFGTGMAVSGHEGNPAFWAGYKGNGETPWEAKNNSQDWLNLTNFYVTNAGALYCNNATIHGTINAIKGSFSRDITIEGISLKEWITEGGYIYKIHATHGEVGGWTIDNTELAGQTKDGNSTVKLVISPSRCYYEYSPTNYRETKWWNVVNAGYYYAETYSGDSDLNVKNSISNLEGYDTMFDNLKPCCYKYNYGTSGRYHTGFIAQEVASAITNAGMTSKDFAGIIHLDRPNENGSEWLLRRDEFVALNTWQIQKLKSRVANLENTVVELTTQIQTLTAG